MTQLDVQSKCIQQLQEEQNGRVQVNPVDTIQMALFIKHWVNIGATIRE